MGIPKRCNWQAAPDEGVSPGLDSALFWYCGEAISMPLVKMIPKFSHNHEPGPSFQSGAELPPAIRSPQNPDNAGTPRLSPIVNNCPSDIHPSDIQIDDFDSGAAADDRSALDKSKLLEDSLAQWTGMGEATFKPGTKMEEAINVLDPEPGPWGTNTASSRPRRPVSAQACLSPLQPQRIRKQLETANAAALGTFESAFSRRLLSPAHHRFEGSSKQSQMDVKTSPGTIKHRLDAGLQRCMQLRLTETLENGGLLYLGDKDDKAITALKSLDKKNKVFELRRSESDTTLRRKQKEWIPLTPTDFEQKLGWLQCPQGQISRGLKKSKGLEVLGRGLKPLQRSSTAHAFHRYI